MEKDKKIALATEGSTINLKNTVTAGDKITSNFVKDAVPLYATGTGSKINVVTPDSLKFYLGGIQQQHMQKMVELSI